MEGPTSDQFKSFNIMITAENVIVEGLILKLTDFACKCNI